MLRPKTNRNLGAHDSMRASAGRFDTQVMDFSNAPAKTEAIFNEIVKAARQMRTIEYGELEDIVDLPAHFMGRQLGFIRDACQERRLPWLTAIVVKRDTKLPSTGIFEGVDGMSGNVSSPVFEVWWRAMALHVFTTDWSTVKKRH